MTKLEAENLLRIAEYGDALIGAQNHKVFVIPSARSYLHCLP
jgi:hypothetical protein